MWQRTQSKTKTNIGSHEIFRKIQLIRGDEFDFIELLQSLMYNPLMLSFECINFGLGFLIFLDRLAFFGSTC